MIVTLSKQVGGITYFWFMYRDGRTIQMYHGVTEQWKLDQDVSDSIEEQYIFRHQAKLASYLMFRRLFLNAYQLSTRAVYSASISDSVYWNGIDTFIISSKKTYF